MNENFSGKLRFLWAEILALDAIETVCDCDGRELDVFEGVLSLTDKSLLSKRTTGRHSAFSDARSRPRIQRGKINRQR